MELFDRLKAKRPAEPSEMADLGIALAISIPVVLLIAFFPIVLAAAVGVLALGAVCVSAVESGRGGKHDASPKPLLNPAFRAAQAHAMMEASQEPASTRFQDMVRPINPGRAGSYDEELARPNQP
jgi:hypothetical protein